MVEYRETLDQFCSQSVEDKVRFLFKLYDKNGALDRFKHNLNTKLLNISITLLQATV